MAILLVGVAIVCYGAHKQQSTDDLMRKCEQARSISDYNSLDNLSKQLIDKGNKSGNQRAIGYGNFYRGLSLMFTGKGKECTALLDKAWNISSEISNDSIGALVMNARGIYEAIYANNNFLAQRFFFRSLDLSTDSHFESLKIRVYGNLLILSKSAADPAGLDYAKRIYNYGTTHKDFEQTFMGAYYLALFYHLKGNNKEALKYVDTALDLYKHRHYDDIASVYVLYSEIETDAGHLDKAQSLAHEAIVLSQTNKQASLLPDAYLQLARAESKAGMYYESNIHAQQAIKASQDYSFTNRIIDCNKLIASNFIAMGDNDSAVGYLLKANEGMDTLSSVNMDRMLHERDILDSIQHQEEQSQIREQHIKSQRNIMLVLLVSIIVLATLLVVIIISYRSRVRLIKRIVAQNVSAVEKHKESQRRISELEKQMDEQRKPSGVLTDDADRKQTLYNNICELMENDKLYKEPQLNRERLAAMLGTNRTYLSAVIKEKSGMNYQQFINSYRIQEAIRILSDNDSADYPLKQLWNDLGFSSSSTFYKLFQQAVGITPSVFRKQYLEMNK